MDPKRTMAEHLRVMSTMIREMRLLAMISLDKQQILLLLSFTYHLKLSVEACYYILPSSKYYKNIQHMQNKFELTIFVRLDGHSFTKPS